LHTLTQGTPGYVPKAALFFESFGAHSGKVQHASARDHLGYLDGSLKQRLVAFAAKACGMSAR
jgi:hypothetical protein